MTAIRNAGAPIRTLDDAEARHTGYWFSRGATAFFRSRVSPTMYPDDARKVSYFVSSEQFDYQSPRLYTVRVIDWATGDVDTVGEFQQYGTLAQARGAIARRLREPVA
jgi:hypothetical protein